MVGGWRRIRISYGGRMATILSGKTGKDTRFASGSIEITCEGRISEQSLLLRFDLLKAPEGERPLPSNTRRAVLQFRISVCQVKVRRKGPKRMGTASRTGGRGYRSRC